MFVIPNNFIKDIIKNANDLIKYNNTVTTGEITVDNGDGTYDVKIANAGSAIPDVETLAYDAVFSVGEIVTIGFENGCKESPKIIGHSKKVKQDPKQVEVDYSGGCAGLQTVTVTIEEMAGKNGGINLQDANYNILNSSVSGNEIFLADDLGFIEIINTEGGVESTVYEISRAFVFFDCSSIPTNANIISVILSLYGAEVEDEDGNFYLIVQDGQPNYPHNPLILSDYDRSKYSNNGGQIAASAVNIGVYNNITLNPNGRNWVNKGGITKFCLRSSKDIASVTPGEDKSNWLDFESGVGMNVCKLIITYTI